MSPGGATYAGGRVPNIRILPVCVMGILLVSIAACAGEAEESLVGCFEVQLSSPVLDTVAARSGELSPEWIVELEAIGPVEAPRQLVATARAGSGHWEWRWMTRDSLDIAWTHLSGGWGVYHRLSRRSFRGDSWVWSRRTGAALDQVAPSVWRRTTCRGV